MGLTKDLNQPLPQTSRVTQTMIHGIKLNHTCALLGFSVGAAAGAAIVAAESSWVRSAGEVHISLGCHTCKKRIRQAMDMSEAPMSTIQGLPRLERRSWGPA